MDDGLSYNERRHREQLEYAEDEEPEPVVEHRLEADVAIPNIPVPRSSDGNVCEPSPLLVPHSSHFLREICTKRSCAAQYWVIRMPNYVKVDSKPFHPDTYIGPEQEDEDGQHTESLREKSMSIKLKVENTLRWRWSKDSFGQDVSAHAPLTRVSFLISDVLPRLLLPRQTAPAHTFHYACHMSPLVPPTQ